MATTSQFEPRLTYDDLVRMPDDGMRHEIIDGVHYMTPSRTLRHQLLAKRLLLPIATYLEGYPDIGELMLGPFDTVFTQWDVVAPDFVFVSADQFEILRELNIEGAPALIIEIVSPDTRDRDLGVKRQLYDRGGVREYWIVDPDTNRISVHRRAEDRSFPNVVTLDRAQTITTPLLPGFGLTLEKLFRP